MRDGPIQVHDHYMPREIAVGYGDEHASLTSLLLSLQVGCQHKHNHPLTKQPHSNPNKRK